MGLNSTPLASSSSTKHWQMIPQSRIRQIVISAYSHLTHDELSLFCTLRKLPLTGNLALSLANYDLDTLEIPSSLPSINAEPPVTTRERVGSLRKGLDLPVEIIAEILDQVGDWELSTSVGLPTSLPRPPEWTRATPMDEAILTGYLPLVTSFANTETPFTKIGASVAVRFGFIHIIEYLRSQHKTVFDREFGSRGELIPLKASQYSHIPVLTWWKNSPDFPKDYDAEVIDSASRAGAVDALQWWHTSSGLPMVYTEAALEGASLKGQIAVLNWWNESGLPLKIGKVMESASTSGEIGVLEWWARSSLEQPKYEKQALYLASCHGRVNVLEWWAQSGLQMIYDADVLVGATRMNRPTVLEWWDHSGLPVPFRLCDIEEALEDAISGGGAAMAWWRRKGVDFQAGDAEWSKIQTLQ